MFRKLQKREIGEFSKLDLCYLPICKENLIPLDDIQKLVNDDQDLLLTRTLIVDSFYSTPCIDSEESAHGGMIEFFKDFKGRPQNVFKVFNHANNDANKIPDNLYWIVAFKGKETEINLILAEARRLDFMIQKIKNKDARYDALVKDALQIQRQLYSRILYVANCKKTQTVRINAIAVPPMAKTLITNDPIIDAPKTNTKKRKR